jgi:1-acyl-sn-glycerol-3-phosphate acyltransferase
VSQKTHEKAFRLSPLRDASFDINVSPSANPPAEPARKGRRWLQLGYGCYVWIALLSVVLPMCALLVLTPTLHGRRKIARGAARLFCAVIGSPVRVEGAEIDVPHPSIVVANHASYLDGIILTAALPSGFTYLIKQQMLRVPIAGFVLRRLGSAFVDRNDRYDRQRSARTILALAERGDALGFFPEGTFDGTPGLKAFHLGAFSAAARAGLPILPVVIYGARHKLPSGKLLAAPGPLSVRICPPVPSSGAGSAQDLMLATRRAMLAVLDEPDLAPAVATSPSS